MKKLLFIALLFSTFMLTCYAKPKKVKTPQLLNLDEFLVEADYDFVFEVKNNSSGNITVQPVLDRMYSGPNFGDGLFATGSEVVIEKGKTRQFMYRFNREKENRLNLDLHTVVFGSYIKLDGEVTKGHIENPFIYENGQNNLVGMKLLVEVTDDFLSNRTPLVKEALTE